MGAELIADGPIVAARLIHGGSCPASCRPPRPRHSTPPGTEPTHPPIEAAALGGCCSAIGTARFDGTVPFPTLRGPPWALPEMGVELARRREADDRARCPR